MEGQLTKELYTSILCMCKDDVRKAKAQNELRLVGDVTNNNKIFFCYVKKKRKSKEAVSLLQGEDRKVVIGAGDTAHLLNSCFVSGFSQKGKVKQLNSCSNEELEVACSRKIFF